MTADEGVGVGGPPRSAPAADAEPLQSRDWIAREHRVTPGTVLRWVRDGLKPAEGGGPGRQARFRPSDVVAWRVAQLEARTAGLQGIDPRRARAMKDIEQGRLAAQLYRKRAGELLEVAEIERAWLVIVAAVRSKLLALPSGLAPSLVGAADEATIAARLRVEIHAALRELAAWSPPESAGGRNGTPATATEEAAVPVPEQKEKPT
jgi:hypothetical protein